MLPSRLSRSRPASSLPRFLLTHFNRDRAVRFGNPLHFLPKATRNVELNHLCHSILRSTTPTVSDFLLWLPGVETAGHWFFRCLFPPKSTLLRSRENPSPRTRQTR